MAGFDRNCVRESERVRVSILQAIETGNYAFLIRTALENGSIATMDSKPAADLFESTGMTPSEFENTMRNAVTTMDQMLGAEQTDQMLNAQIRANPDMESAILKAAIELQKEGVK